MSKGPGRIQQAIKALFAAEPDNAFTTAELCERIYGVVDSDIEKKHRVTVMRAAKAIPSLRCCIGESLGNQLIFYDPLNVMSYAMARLKMDSDYRNADPRTPSHWIKTEADLRKRLRDCPHNRELVSEGGSWWLHTEIERAKAKGEAERAAHLQAEADKKFAETMNRLGEKWCRHSHSNLNQTV
jgi:hypothetical protein